MTWYQIVWIILGSLMALCFLLLLILVISMRVDDIKLDKEIKKISDEYYNNIYKVVKDFLYDLLTKHLITAQEFVDLRQLANIAYHDRDENLLIDLVKNPKTYLRILQ